MTTRGTWIFLINKLCELYYYVDYIIIVWQIQWPKKFHGLLQWVYSIDG